MVVDSVSGSFENDTARPTTAATAINVIQVKLLVSLVKAWGKGKGGVHETDQCGDEMDLSKRPHFVDVGRWGFSERVSNSVCVNKQTGHYQRKDCSLVVVTLYASAMTHRPHCPLAIIEQRDVGLTP